MLTVEETKKYNRQIKLEGFGTSSQEKLKAGKVLVVGLGGLGSPVSFYLAASGVGTLGLVEFDKIDLPNLSRQILYCENEIGNLKLDIAVEKLSKLNSNIKIVPFKERLTKKNADEILGQFSLIIDGSDNFETRHLVNDNCVKLGIPLVHGSVSGFQGFISLFNLKSSSPCYRCLYPEIPNNGSGCSEIGVLPTVAGLIGVQMAHECIKFLTGCGDTLDGKVLFLRKNNFETFNLKKDPHCPICGTGKNLDKNIFQELTLDEFNKIKHQAEVIDIREEIEFKEVNLGGTNIPFTSFEIGRVAHLIDKELIIICYSGERSKVILETLKNNNFRKIFNLKGGIREAILN